MDVVESQWQAVPTSQVTEAFFPGHEQRYVSLSGLLGAIPIGHAATIPSAMIVRAWPLDPARRMTGDTRFGNLTMYPFQLEIYWSTPDA